MSDQNPQPDLSNTEPDIRRIHNADKGTSITFKPDFGCYWPDYDKNPEGCFNKVQNHIKEMDKAIELSKGRSVVIQAGGHAGLWAKRLSGIFSLVITFEPDPALFECMRYNLKDTKNVAIFEAALGAGRGNAWYTAAADAGSGKVSDYEVDVTSVAVPVTVIDELKFSQQETGEVGKVDLILLDVEGLELEVLKGAHETIMRDHPVIQVEKGPRTNEVALFLMGRGYGDAIDVGRDVVFEFTGIARAFGIGHKHGNW